MVRLVEVRGEAHLDVHLGHAQLDEAGQQFIAHLTDAVAALTQKEIYSIWGEGKNLCYNQKDAALELLPESGGGEYTLKQVK